MTRSTKTKKPTQTEQPQQAAPKAQPQQPQRDTNISINDLLKLANFLDLACRRGAFGASEMAEVGETYNKVATFLSVVAEHTKDKEEKDV